MSDVHFYGRVRPRDMWRLLLGRKIRWVVDFDELLAAVEAADRKNKAAYQEALNNICELLPDGDSGSVGEG